MKRVWEPITEYHAEQCLVGHGSVPPGYKRLVPHPTAKGQWIRRRNNGKYLRLSVQEFPLGCGIGALRKDNYED